jgi:hypothetical protein
MRAMKVLTAGGGSYLTGSEIADAVVRYGLALAKRRDVDLVDIPFVGDGQVRRAIFTIGWRYEAQSVTCAVDGDELVEVGTTFALDAKANAVARRRAHAFTAEEAAALTWPEPGGDLTL